MRFSNVKARASHHLSFDAGSGPDDYLLQGWFLPIFIQATPGDEVSHVVVRFADLLEVEYC